MTQSLNNVVFGSSICFSNREVDVIKLRIMGYVYYYCKLDLAFLACLIDLDEYIHDLQSRFALKLIGVNSL